MAAQREAVLLLHGLWLNRLAMFLLGRSLERDGYAPVSLTYRSMRGSLDEHLAAVERRIASIPADTVHLVGHSLGGVVALRYLQRAPNARIGRTVLLGAPVAGVQAAQTLARRAGGRLLLGSFLEVFGSGFDIPIAPRYCVGAIAGSKGFGLGAISLRLPSPNDGVVTVDETRLPGLADHIVLPVSHSGMLISSRVARQVAAFLQRGHFEP
jgi:pimeloyl-ACP methyl ester carboxylesterase